MKVWRFRRMRVAASVIVASHLLCASARAGDGGAIEASSDQKARALYNEGIKAIKKEEWVKARESLTAAFQLNPHYRIAANLGWAEWMSGAPREAAEHLTFFLREAKEIGVNDRREAEKMLTQAKSKIGTVTIEVDAAGAELFLDGKKLGTSPLKEALFVEPGSRRFEARKTGFRPASLWVNVAPGSSPVVAIGLAKAEAPAPGTPPAPVFSQDATVEAAAAQRRTTLIHAGIGVSAALAAVGIGTAIGAAVTRAEGKNAWNEKDCNTSLVPGCQSDYDAMEKQYFYLGNTAFWSFVGSAAVGGATAIYALTTAKRTKAGHAPRTNVMLSVQGGGFILRGNF